jgi:hypothetical protein
MSTTPSLVSPPVGSHDHDHGHGHQPDHAAAHGHGHAEIRVPRRVAVPPSLLRASLGQRLAVAIPVAIALWALALWVIYGSAV